ncbi:MAG TPA: error-prone DNA polymerase [Acidimicrobiales bacterium]|nr:error-prone DNA polymerase [Acidimicrobiales bacterium]
MTEYAELHAHSGFSFLDGSSDPEELVAEADRLGLAALALTDHHGFYGVVRFAEAARVCGLPTVFGTEVTLAPAGLRTGDPDPTGAHLVVLARDPEGYARLSTVLADAHLAGGEKGKPVFTLDALARAAAGHWLVLSGCRKGAVPAALMDAGPSAASKEVGHLVDAFGRANVALELWDHGDPVDTARNDALARLAVEWGVDAVATNNVHYATPAGYRLATTLAAVRARRPLAELEGWLPPAPVACLRSAGEQSRRFARWPGVVERAAELGRACAFDLRLVAPRLPDFPVPPGMDEQGYLRHLVHEGALARYGPPESERVAGAWRQIEHELDVIGTLGFAGYFLVVWDIAQVCKRLNIYCQGRGSAANSAVCYALGVTNVDAVDLGLLFERFLSPARDGPPDIDVDIESERREEVIQYVYERYGRRHAAQVANVITYRPRSAVRDVGKAFGFTPEQVDAWSAGIDAGHGRGPSSAAAVHEAVDPSGGTGGAGGAGGVGGMPPLVAELAAEVLDRPRHLGIHSAGMVLCDRPVVEVCPVEWGRMEGRSVLQWDKDDCAAIGLVKFDLLGLGMLEALHRMVDLVRDFYGVEVDLAQLPQEDEVYDLLCAADTVGVFQVESRAQMGTLPRVRPRTFYDIAIEVALIRPGPIQGHAVNPYIRRRRGEEEVTYLHPLLEPILERTLGVPLFQEQLMEMAVAIAGFSAADADELRQAMAAKRSAARMEKMRARLFEGMAERGVTGAVADQVFDALAAFANFGFPESHSVSFAHLVYSSAWLKLHYPAAFTAGLLNSQPMGFWSPQSLVADARRHGVRVRRPHVNRSEVGASLEGVRSDAVLLLGLASVRGVGEAAAERIVAGRPWNGSEDLVRRAGVTQAQLETLAAAGALDPVGEDVPGTVTARRRRLLWGAGAAAMGTPDRLPGVVVGAEAPPLPEPSPYDSVADDLWALGLAPERTAMHLARERLEAMGVTTAAGLESESYADGARAVVAGVVTHRQHPETARGAVFVNLEDETGHINVVFSRGAWARWKHLARHTPVLLIRGRVRKGQGAVSFDAERVEGLGVGTAVPASRDFR